MSNTDHSLEYWVDKFATMLFRIAFARVMNTADAEDILQEVYVKYLRYEPEFNNEEHAKAWFIRVTCQQSRELGRQRWRKDASLDDGVSFANQADLDETDLYESNIDMKNALEELSDNDREVIHLSYYEGFNASEIAQLIGAKPATVRMRLTRARRKLQGLLEAR